MNKSQIKPQEKNDSSKSSKYESENISEIDIFSKKYGFDEKFVDKMLEKDCKWKEKKEAFDNMTKYTDPKNVKSIKNTDRTYFIEMVKKLLKQPNINVIHSIINALNNLCLGLNSNFIEAKDLFSILLNFLKEKKESLIFSLITCLTNFSLIMNDLIINEKLLNYCSGKPILCNIAKINLCTFFEKMIEKKDNIQLNLYSNFIIHISKYLDDPNSEVREKSAKLMAFLNYKKNDVFISIEKNIKLDEKKINKIKEYEKLYVNISCNTTNKKNPFLSDNKNIENNIKNKLLENNDSKAFKYNNLNIQYFNDNKSKDNKINTINSKNSENSFISDDNYLILVKENLIVNKEEIISYVQKKIDNLDNSLFNSVNWEERKEAFIILNEFLSNENNSEEIYNSYKYYFKYILINNRLFQEINSVVLIQSIICINTLIDKINEFSEKYYKIIISLLIYKLNDKKIIREISNTIEKLTNKISTDEVISTFLDCLKNKPKLILNEGIQLIKNIIDNSINRNNNIFITNKTQSQYNEISSIKTNFDIYNTQRKNLTNNQSNKFNFSVSKTPIIPTKKYISKYNYNIIDVLPADEGELPSLIQNLYGNDIPTKNLSLVEIKKILIHYIGNNNINESQIKDILKAFNMLLYSISTNIKSIKNKDNNMNKNEFTLLRYLLDDYILIVNRKSLIINIADINLIYNCYETLLLLISTKELKNINQGVEIINILNTIILCLLTNFNKTLTIKTLINIISNYKNNSNNDKICSLAIKCLNKFKQKLSELKERIDNNEIFITLYKFFRDFEKTNKNLKTHTDNEKISLLMINSLIEEYVNIYNSSIWDIYNQALNNDMLKMDIFLKRTIEISLKEINQKNMMDNISNFSFNKKTQNENINQNSDESIKDIMPYINKLKNESNKMSQEEQNNCYFEIVFFLRDNKINISILSNKIDGEIFAKILEFYYGINSGKNTKDFSLISKANNKSNIIEKNNINKKTKNKQINPSLKINSKFKKDIKFKKNIKKKEMSDQSKRIMEYKNKVEYLTESNKDRNKNTLEKNNNENKSLNCNINTINNIVENTLNKINEINSNNKETNITIEEAMNMKKQLEKIRKNLNKK